MKVKINQSIASPAWSYKRGQVVEMEAQQAEAWINSGLAMAIEAAPAPAQHPPAVRAKPRSNKG